VKLPDGLKHKSALVRCSAAKKMVKGGADAIEPLINVLGDKDNDVHMNAAKSLGKIGDTWALHALKQALAAGGTQR